MIKKHLVKILLTIVALLGGYVGVDQLRGFDNVGTTSKTILNAVVASTTSSAIEIDGARRVTLLLSTNIPVESTASTTFTVDVSLDGTNFFDYNKLVENLADTNAESLTRISSKAFTATSTGYIVSMDLENDVYKSMKVKAVLIEPQGATHITDATCKALIEY